MLYRPHVNNPVARVYERWTTHAAGVRSGRCCVGDFLAANSTDPNRPNWPAEEAALLFLFQRCFFRCRLSVPKLKPRLRQNSLRRMPLVTNSATICRTSARVRRLGATNFFSMVIELLQHRHDSAKQVCWSNAYIGRGARSGTECGGFPQ